MSSTCAAAPPGCDGYTQLENQIRNLGYVIRCSDGRMLYANYGKACCAGSPRPTRARWINGTPSFGRYQDFVSTDLYWFTDPNERNKWAECWLPEGEGAQMNRSQVERASNYGYQIDYLRKLDAMDGQRQPISNFVEVGCPWSECGADPDFIKPAEIRAAVWHSIIAGARGIIYFQHTFNGPSGCLSHHALRDPLSCYSQVQSAVTDLNAQVRLLAPVLNAPTVVSGTTSTSSIRSMVKWHNGHFYVFAGSRNNQSSTGTISIPCVGNATAARLGGSGSVPISGGSFSDQFADGNAVHIYRLDGGSTCGLA